jgi:hypothetical protein
MTGAKLNMEPFVAKTPLLTDFKLAGPKIGRSVEGATLSFIHVGLSKGMNA